PIVPSNIPGLIPFFPRLEALLKSGLNMSALVSLGFLGLITAGSCFCVWAWFRILCEWPGSVRRMATALAALMVLVAVGYCDLWSGPDAARIVSYPAFAEFYVGWHRLEAASGPAGSRVSYAGTNIPYYLFGKHLRNQVRYVNVDRHRDWLLHDYQRAAFSQSRGTWPNPRPGWDRMDPN